MAMEIFKLVGSIFVDSSDAEKSISKTDEKAQSVGKTLLNGVGTAAKWGAGLVTSAGAVTTGMISVAKKSAESLDIIDKGSAKIGISKRAYQEWDYILGQNGMSIDKLETGMKTLVASMDGAAGGGKAADAYKERFKALGLSIYDSTGKLKDQETMLKETMLALAGMENGTEKARLATELFGKAGVEMMPMLNNGSQGIIDLTNRAHELGLIVSDDAVAAGVTLGDTMDDVGRSVKSAGVKLGASLMPILQKVINLVISKMPAIQGMFEKISLVLVMVFDQLLPPLMELAEQLLPIISDLLVQLMPIFSDIISIILPPIIELIQLLLPPIVEIVQKLLPPLLELIQPILELLSPLISLLEPILDLITGILSPLTELISGLLTPLVEIASQVIEFALVPLKEHFGFLSDLLSGTVSAAFDLIMNQVDTIKGIFSGLIDFITGIFTGDWEKAWDGIKQIFGSVWEGIKGLFKIPINWIIDGINLFIRGLNKIKVPDWVPLIGGYGFNIKEIPNLYAGGVLEKGQTGFLEGNGAEAVVPLENNRKWTAAVAKDMDAAIGGTSGKEVYALLTDILDALYKIMGLGIYLDGDKLVGSIGNKMDAHLGMIQARKARV